MSANIHYFVYPVSRKHRLIRNGISFSHIRRLQQLISKHAHLIQHISEQIPSVIDSINKSCYKDENGNCVSTTELLNLNSFRSIHPTSEPCMYVGKENIKSLAGSDILRSIHKSYASQIPYDTFASYILLGLAMPRIGCTCRQSGGAEYIEGRPLSTALDVKDKDYQSIYSITLMSDNGAVHKIIAKITTKKAHHYSDYLYEERVYDFLNKNGDSSTKYPLLRYYGSIHTPLKTDGIVHVEHTVPMVGKVMFDIDLKSDLNPKYLTPGTEAIMLLFQNVADTHLDTETYVRQLRKTKSAKETAKLSMKLFKMVAKELLHLNQVFHLAHGDFHAGNCFISHDMKRLIIYDFNLSYFPGLLDGAVLVYPVYNHYKTQIMKRAVFNKLAKSEQQRIMRELYCIDMVRYYGYISYYAKNMFFEEHNTVPQNQVVAKTDGNYILDLTNAVYLTYQHFERKYDIDTFMELFNQTNEFLMSYDYFKIVISFIELLNSVYQFNKKTPIKMNPGDFVQRYVDKKNKDPGWDYGMNKKQKEHYEETWAEFVEYTS